MRVKYSCALSALASACLIVAAAAGALAQEAWHKKLPSVPPQLLPWTDSADPAALKTCRENIAQPSSTTKVGPLQPLRGASVLPAPNRAGTASKKLVGASKVRMYAARVQTTNLWGNPVDLHDVCFFEKVGTTYRFVQVCRMKVKQGSTRLDGCDVSWILRETYVLRNGKWITEERGR